FLTLQAAKRSRVFVNGFHLSDELRKKGIKATPVISSTINESSLNSHFTELKKDMVRVTFVGYLRYSKGIGSLMRLIDRLEESNCNYQFNIVGRGKMFDVLKSFINERNISGRVFLH